MKSKTLAFVLIVLCIGGYVVWETVYNPVQIHEKISKSKELASSISDDIASVRKRVDDISEKTLNRGVIIREEVSKRIDAMLTSDELIDELNSELRLWRLEAGTAGVRGASSILSGDTPRHAGSSVKSSIPATGAR